MNGVQLVKGKDGSTASHEFIEIIALVLREKLEILFSSLSISCLSDGSQARKRAGAYVMW